MRTNSVRMRKQNIIAPDLTGMKRIVMLVEILGGQGEPRRNCPRLLLPEARMTTMSPIRAGILDLESDTLGVTGQGPDLVQDRGDVVGMILLMNRRDQGLRDERMNIREHLRPKKGEIPLPRLHLGGKPNRERKHPNNRNHKDMYLLVRTNHHHRCLHH